MPVDFLKDPAFLGLPSEEKRKVLLVKDPDFKGLPIQEQMKVISRLGQPTPTSTLTDAQKFRIPGPTPIPNPILVEQEQLQLSKPIIPVASTLDFIKKEGPKILGAATVGGLVGGPPGIAAGAIRGGLGAAGMEAVRQLITREPDMSRLITAPFEGAAQGAGTVAGKIATAGVNTARSVGAVRPSSPEKMRQAINTQRTNTASSWNQAVDEGMERARNLFKEIRSKFASTDSKMEVMEKVRRLKDQSETALKKPIDAAYTKFREIVGAPERVRSTIVGLSDEGEAITEDLATPIDLEPVQAALSRTYKELAKTLKKTQQQESPGFQLLEQIMEGPWAADAETVRKTLETAQELSRTAPGVARGSSEGLAVMIVRQLRKVLDEGLKKEAPEALSPLNAGRALTRMKYDIFETAQARGALKTATTKPMASVVGSADQGLTRIDSLVKQIGRSNEPIIAREIMKDINLVSTREGQFDISAFKRMWDRLGPDTQRRLFAQDREALEGIARLKTNKLTPELIEKEGGSKVAKGVGVLLRYGFPGSAVLYLLGRKTETLPDFLK